MLSSFQITESSEFKFMKQFPSDIAQYIYSFDDTFRKKFNIVLKQLCLEQFIRYWDKQRLEYFNLSENTENTENTEHTENSRDILVLVLKRKFCINKTFITLFPVEHSFGKKWYKLMFPELRYPEQIIRGTIRLHRSWNWKYFEVSESFILNNYKVYLKWTRVDEVLRFKNDIYNTWYKYNFYFPRPYLLNIDFEIDEIDHLDIYPDIQTKKHNSSVIRHFKVWARICFSQGIEKNIYTRLRNFLNIQMKQMNKLTIE